MLFCPFHCVGIWTFTEGAESMVSKLLGPEPKSRQRHPAVLVTSYVILHCHVFAGKNNEHCHVFMGNDNSNNASCTYELL